jgi:hypothetical protein
VNDEQDKPEGDEQGNPEREGPDNPTWKPTDEPDPNEEGTATGPPPESVPGDSGQPTPRQA